MTPYEQRLASLREAFPAPVSDPVHDGYVVFSLLRALDQVDALKSQAPILGTPREPDYAAAAQAQLADGPQSLEAVIPQLVALPRRDADRRASAQPGERGRRTRRSPASSASCCRRMYNPNLCSDESGRGFSEAEVRVASMVARLVGYDRGTGRRRVHVRRHRHAAVRREDRPGKSPARHAANGRRANRRSILCLGAKPLRRAERGRLAGHRPARTSSACRRSATTRSIWPRSKRRPARQLAGGQRDRRDRRHDGHDRRLWHRRPGGHPRSCANGWSRSSSSTTRRTSMPTP